MSHLHAVFRRTHSDLPRYFYLSIPSTVAFTGLRFGSLRRRVFRSAIVILRSFERQTRCNINDLIRSLPSVSLALPFLLFLSSPPPSLSLIPPCYICFVATRCECVRVCSSISAVLPRKVKELFGPFANSSTADI